MFNILLSKRWKWPKVLYGLMVLELASTVGALVLFGIASPDLYRTTMWQIGYDNGWNSSPDQILFAYANYRPIPTTPFVWSSQVTEFNLVISVLSMFILLVKLIMFVLHLWYPLLGAVSNAAITALWAVSIWGQAGPDYSDPKHPSPVAWYITKDCSYAKSYNAVGYCTQAKASFAVSVVMCAIFFCNMVLGIWSLIPTRVMLEANKLDVDDLQGDDNGGRGSPTSDTSHDRIWEMRNVRSTTPAMSSFGGGHQQPFTPRTLAFNTLDRQLPLREANYTYT